MTATEVALPDAPFDRYGRRLILPRDKKATKPVPHTRATTISDTLDDKTNLTNWKVRRAAVGMTLRADLHAFVAAHRDDEQALKGKTDELIAAGDLKQAATAGTTLHKWIERANDGTLDRTDPAAPLAHIDAYQRAIDAAGLTVRPELCERIAVLPDVHGTGLHVAGRFDAALEDRTGRLLIADLKTGTYISGLNWAIQLAIYANADSLYTPTAWGGDHEDNPGFDRTEALIIHLPQDADPPVCKILTVDIAQGWHALKVALDVREWRNAGRKLVTEPTWTHHPDLPDPDGHDRIVARIERIKQHPTALPNMLSQWPADIPTPKQMTHPYTGIQVQQLDALLSAIEAAHEVSF
jgi:hypothetical protein